MLLPRDAGIGLQVCAASHPSDIAQYRMYDSHSAHDATGALLHRLHELQTGHAHHAYWPYSQSYSSASPRSAALHGSALGQWCVSIPRSQQRIAASSRSSASVKLLGSS